MIIDTVAGESGFAAPEDERQREHNEAKVRRALHLVRTKVLRRASVCQRARVNLRIDRRAEERERDAANPSGHQLAHISAKVSTPLEPTALPANGRRNRAGLRL